MSANLSESYFSLFGLPCSFMVDRETLDRTYRELQRKLHPDRFANASDQERRLSIQQAARINEAYRVLKDPLSRGQYLLELHGHEFDDERNTTNGDEFLMEQMELREALAEVRGSGDPLQALSTIEDRVTGGLKLYTQRLGTYLQEDDRGGIAGPVDEAMDTVVKMKFYRRLQEELLDLEAELADDLA